MAKQTKTEKKYLSIYGPVSLWNKIKAQSKKEGRSFNAQVIHILSQAFEK